MISLMRPNITTQARGVPPYMMPSSNGNIFRVTGPLWGEFTGHRSVGVFFDLRLNKRLIEQSRRRWFETPSHSLWRHCNDPQCITVKSHGHHCVWNLKIWNLKSRATRLYCLFNSFFGLCYNNLKTPHYWPFVSVIHRSSVDSPLKGPVIRNRFHVVSSVQAWQVHLPKEGVYSETLHADRVYIICQQIINKYIFVYLQVGFEQQSSIK